MYASRMVDDPTNPDPFAVLAKEDPSQLIEFVEQLQNAVDLSAVDADRMAQRIDKLEDDREQLRSRLDQTRDQLATIRSHPFGRLASRLTRAAPRPDIHTADPDTSEPTQGEGNLRVASILDEISDACWSPEFNNVRLVRQSWRKQIESSPPDLLFVESAFNGVDGSWGRRVAHFGGPHTELVELVEHFQNLGIPTVFWNKEDPVNYAWFIGAASLFDHVFTVDSHQVPRYRQQLGHERVHVLPFAAQPTLHFPPPSGAHRTGSVAFAGSYYARKHAERRKQMDMLLVPALEFGLEIYDRMGDTEDPRFAWPERFRSCIVGSVPYAEMGDVYRKHKLFLNVNTVTNSPSMCARRVFELAATGTPIVSGPSRALEAMIPPGIVAVVNSSEDASQAIRRILDEPSGQSTQAGPEWIADGHTYGHRLATITEVLESSIAPPG